MSSKHLSKIVRAEQGRKQNVLGDEETVKLCGADTGGQLLLIEQTSLPGVGIPLHVHINEDEIFHVISGSLKVVVGKEEHVLEAGDLAFCPRGIPHSWEVVGTERARVLLTNTPAGLEHMLSALAALPPDAGTEEIQQISSEYGISFCHG